MQHFGPFSVAIAFWVFVTVAAVAGIVAHYKKRSLALAPLRAAIERGQQLDPAVVERLRAPESRDGRLNALYLKVGGIVTIAAGIGVALLSFFLAQVVPVALYRVLGGGIVVVVAARVAERHGNP